MTIYTPPPNPADQGTYTLYDPLGGTWQWQGPLEGGSTADWSTPVGGGKVMKLTWTDLLAKWCPLSDVEPVDPGPNQGSITRITYVAVRNLGPTIPPEVIGQIHGWTRYPATIDFARKARNRLILELREAFPDDQFSGLIIHN
jgi:hypothetical protein